MRATGRYALAADRIFDGERLHDDAVLIVEGPRIAVLLPRRDLPGGLPVTALPAGAMLAPGFIDVQVNGGGDVLFNATPTAEALAVIAAAHRRFGTTALLPTLISDRPESMAAALKAVRQAAHPGILGVHFEGPFLSPERAGVHDRSALRAPEPADFARLTALRGGVTLATLAPEIVPPGFVARLAAAGVRVAIGHSDASYEQTRQALAEGATGFTHLFNAMRPLASRDPGPVAAALETPGCWYGLIVDGAHVHPAMLRLALRGAGRPMLVTDAMPPVGGTQARFALYGETISVRDGRCLRDDGTLAGAALDMATAVRNCVCLLGLPLTGALHMAAAAPADFLGLGGRLGRIAPGCRADLVALDPEAVRVLATWVAGEAEP